MLAALRRARSGPSAVVVAVGCALAWMAMGVGTASARLAAATAARADFARFLSQLDALPPLREAAAREIVLDLPGDDLARLCRARPGRRLAASVDEGMAAGRLRVLRWAPPKAEGLLSTRPCQLLTILDAVVDPGMELVAPGPGAALAARDASDEPEFRFRTADADPDLHDLRVLVVSAGPGPDVVVLRDLEEATVRREPAPRGAELAWRPGWRPMEHAERELRWEDGDLCPRGSAFWWTVVASPDGAPVGRMAAPRAGRVLP
jgi:hypothetical protein